MRDGLAGVVLSALLVPTGLAYAAAMGLPPSVGLYATIIPLVVYALIGPSRILVMGPESLTIPLIAALVASMSGGDPRRAAELAALLSIASGLLVLAAGVSRFGFLADLLSKPVRIGYLHAIALLVVMGQVPTLLGLRGGFEGLPDSVRAISNGVRDRGVNGWALGLGAGALVVVLILRRIDRRLPSALVAIVAAVVIAEAAGLGTRGVPVVGRLPRGLPVPGWPGIRWDEIPRLLAAAVGISFITIADTTVLSRAFAMRSGQRVDPNREIIALGAVNIVTGLFRGFPASCSSTRTPVAEESGATTQLAGLVAAAVCGFVVLVVPGVFRNLPSAVLGAIVVSAAIRLVDLNGVRRMWVARRSESVLAAASFVSVAVLGPIQGIGAAIGLSILDYLRKVWRPYTTELVRVDGLHGYHDITRHPEGRRVPGLVLYRFDAPLFFANAGYFEQDLLRRIDRTGGTRWVVISGEPITDMDSTAADEFAHLLDHLDDLDVRLVFAELKGSVRDRLVPYGLVDRIGREYFFRTTSEAVRAYVRASGVSWRDWDDDSGPANGGEGPEPGNSAAPAS